MGLQFQTLTFESLRGINTKKSKTQKSINEAEDCCGGFFDIKGSFVKRKGGSKYSTTALSSPILSLYDFEYRTSGTVNHKLMGISGTNLYSGDSGTLTSIKSGLTADTRMSFAKHVPFTTEYLFGSNSKDAVLKYDGTTVTNAGIVRPASTPSAAASAGGSLAVGTYLIRVTYVRDPIGDEGQESNPSDDVTVTTAGANLTINLTSIPVSSDTQVTKRFIYITEVGGAILYKHGSINDNTTTTYTITSLGTLGAELQFDHDVPPLCKYLDSYKSRLVGARTDDNFNRFFWTKPLDVWYWPQGDLDQDSINYEDISNKPITAIKSFYDWTLIFFEDELWKFALSSDGISPLFERIKSDELIGCVANETIVVHGSYCYFLGRSGYYRTDGTNIEEVSAPISDFFNLYSDSSEYQINKSAIEVSNAVLDKENELIILSMPTGASTYPNVSFAMGLNGIMRDENTGELTPNWCPWKGFATYSSTNLITSGRNRWVRSDENGYIFTMDSLDGDGSNVTNYVTSSGSTTLSDSTQSWTVNLYSGLTVRIIGGKGTGQSRKILSNTGTQLTVDTAWSITLDTTSKYAIAGILYWYKHAWNDYGQSSRYKRWRYVRPRFTTTGAFPINAYFGYDYIEADTDEFQTSLSEDALWDVGFWDESYFDGAAISQDKQGVESSRNHIASSFKIENNASGQNIIYHGCDKIFQFLGVR